MEGANLSTSTWDDQGSVAIYADALYDAQPVIGTDSFVVARTTADDEITWAMYIAPYSWVDTDWVDTPVNGTDVAPRILGVYAHGVDGDVLVTWQSDADQFIYTTQASVSDGAPNFTVRTFTDFPIGVVDQSEPTGLVQAWQVTHARTGANEVAVLIEATPNDVMTVNPDQHAHYVAGVLVNSNNATPTSNEHWTPNLNLGSRAWTWANGTTTSGSAVDLYCLCTYKSVYTHDWWGESKAWVMHFDLANWHAQDTGATCRPRSVANINSVGVPDGRQAADSPASGVSPYVRYLTRRANHLGSPCYAGSEGAMNKSMLIPAIAFARIEQRVITNDDIGPDDQLQSVSEPAGPCCVLYEYMHEDPWLAPRDPRESAAPVDNFRRAYPYAMHQSVEVGRSLVVAGGCPSVYDGSQTVEVGFPWKPEIVSAVAETNEALSGPGNVIGWYQYMVCYRWVDAQGQTHRSAPAIRTVYHDAGDTMRLRVRAQNISLKGENRFYPAAQPIEIDVYRTTYFVLADLIAQGGLGDFPVAGLFYRVFGSTDSLSFNRPQDTPVNDPEARFIEIVDGVGDEDLVQQGLAPYQLSVSGVVPTPPTQPPAASVCAVWRNRVWLTSGEDSRTIYYSREVTNDAGSDFLRGVEFNDTNAFQYDGIEDCTGMVPFGEGMVVFTRPDTLFMSGDGNDALGQGANLEIRYLHKGTGCIEPRSILLSPVGIFFQAMKGIYLLNGGMGLDHVSAGAGISDIINDAGNVRSATLLEDRHQIRLVCNGPRLYERTWTITIGSAELGEWAIAGLPVPITYTATTGATTAIIAAGLSNAVAQATGLEGIVASVDRVSNVITIVLTATHDNLYTLDVTGPTDFTASAALSSTAFIASPIVLLYDYFHKMWAVCDMVSVSSTESSNVAVAGAAWRGVDPGTAHVVLHEGGLHVERGERDPTPYIDETSTGGVGVRIDVTTAWIHLAGISGFKRVRRMWIMTRRENDGPMEAEVQYDRDGSFDGDEPVPSSHEWDSPAPAALQLCPREQRVTAMRVRIFEPAEAPATENVVLVSLDMEVGTKKGGAKRPGSQRA